MKITHLVLLLISFSLFPIPFAEASRQEKATAILKEELKKQKIPGMTAAVAIDGKIVWSRALGYSDLETGVRTTRKTVFRIASISKTFTAVSAMQLSEQGKLALEDKIETHCPTFPAKPWPITIRQLLGHLGGVRHYNDKEYETPSAVHYENIIAPIDIFKNDPLLHEPGSEYYYTTYGFNLVGCAVQGAGGAPFVDILKRNIFDPAGLTQTQADDITPIIPHRTRGYRLSADGKVINARLADTSNKIPGGGISSTSEDLVTYASAVHAGKLMQEKTLGEMFTIQKTKSGKETGYGLGWGVSERNGMKIVSHSGSQDGAKSLLYTVPEKKLAIAVLANLEDAALPEMTKKIVDLFLCSKASGFCDSN